MKSFIKSFLVYLLTCEARMVMRRVRPAVVAVTGSVGKTGTKDAIYAVLKNHMHVRKSEKSYNSELGVPLSVLGIANPGTNPLRWARTLVEGLMVALHPGDYPDVLVLEMGVDHPGDMDRLTQWITPDIVVLTRFPDVPVHVEYFASPEDVAAEKTKLLHALAADGVVVYNNDDERICAAVAEVRQRAVGFSRYSISPFAGASETIIQEQGVPVGFEFVLNTGDTSRVVRVQGALGTAYVYMFTAAIAVGSLFDISLDDAVDALRTYTLPPGRSRLIPGIRGSQLVDDTYNASPVAMEESLRTLRSIKTAKRRIAVLGDMLELGSYSIDAHAHAGMVAADCVDVLMTVGVRARGIASAAMDAGLAEENVFQYDDTAEAARELEYMIVEGDYILVKGSQGMRMERIVEEVMAEPERAEELLVRQDAFWKMKP